MTHGEKEEAGACMLRKLPAAGLGAELRPRLSLPLPQAHTCAFPRLWSLFLFVKPHGPLDGEEPGPGLPRLLVLLNLFPQLCDGSDDPLQ